MSRSNLTRELRKTPDGRPCSLLEYPYGHERRQESSEVGGWDDWDNNDNLSPIQLICEREDCPSDWKACCRPSSFAYCKAALASHHPSTYHWNDWSSRIRSRKEQCETAWKAGKFKELVKTAKVQGWVGEFQKALTTAQDLYKVSDRDEVLISIVKAQARAGKFQEALTIASCHIHSAYDRAKALTGIAEVQAVAGNSEMLEQPPRALTTLVTKLRRSSLSPR